MEKNKKTFELILNSDIYSLSVVFGAAYIFIDKAYISLDGDPKKKIKVFFKAKPETSHNELKQIVDDFKNELLNYSLREQIVKSNQKVREIIIAQALLSPLYNAFSDFTEDSEEEEDYIEDPLGITKTWEKHFGKKEKLSVKKKKNAKT